MIQKFIYVARHLTRNTHFVYIRYGCGQEAVEKCLHRVHSQRGVWFHLQLTARGEDHQADLRPDHQVHSSSPLHYTGERATYCTTKAYSNLNPSCLHLRLMRTSILAHLKKNSKTDDGNYLHTYLRYTEDYSGNAVPSQIIESVQRLDLLTSRKRIRNWKVRYEYADSGMK